LDAGANRSQSARAPGSLVQGREQRVAEHSDLPAPEFANLGEPGAIFWTGPRDRFQRAAATQDAGVEADLLRHTRAYRLQAVDSGVERGIVADPGRALDVGQRGFVQCERPTDALDQFNAVPLGEDRRDVGGLREICGGPREGTADGKQCVVPDDSERGPVLLRPQILAPAI